MRDVEQASAVLISSTMWCFTTVLKRMELFSSFASPMLIIYFACWVWFTRVLNLTLFMKNYISYFNFIS